MGNSCSSSNNFFKNHKVSQGIYVKYISQPEIIRRTLSDCKYVLFKQLLQFHFNSMCYDKEVPASFSFPYGFETSDINARQQLTSFLKQSTEIAYSKALTCNFDSDITSMQLNFYDRVEHREILEKHADSITNRLFADEISSKLATKSFFKLS